MKRHPVAGAYARALLEVGEERRESDTYEHELSLLADSVLGSPDLRVFFDSPKIPRDEKKRVVERAFGGRLSAAVVNLLCILIDRGRQGLFQEIVENYLELYDDVRGRTHVQISSAAPLDEGSRTRLLLLLEQKLAREVIPEERIDQQLLGGLTVRIEDTVLDGSLRTQLSKVREAMTSQRLGSDLIDENQS